MDEGCSKKSCSIIYKMGNQPRQYQVSDNIDPNDENIVRLVSTLPRVDAPSDFAFHVKARIARGSTAKGAFSWFPMAAKAGVPAVLVLTIGGYFALPILDQSSQQSGEVASGTETVSVPAAEPQPLPQVQAVLPFNQAIANPIDPVISSAQPASRTVAATKVSTSRRPVTRRSVDPETKGSGSFDAAAPITRKLDAGTEPVVETQLPGSPAGEVMTRIGINALYGEGGWKAESVTPNTKAARAGIKAGDIIESIDDQTLTDLSSVGKPAKGKRVRVLREGKSHEIVIEP